MKKIGREPRLLPNVMEAIASLKEKQGSTQKTIVERVSDILKRSKGNSRNITMQVRRALEHGIHSGVIKRKSGKFRLGLDKRDYAIFRRFKQINEPKECLRTRRSRRRGRKGRRSRVRRGRRSRRGRRRAASTEEEHSEVESAYSSDTPEPSDKGRRRRRRRRGRRRGRRGRRHTSEVDARSESSGTGEGKESKTVVQPETKRSDQQKVDPAKPTNSNFNHATDRHQERNNQDRNPHSHEEEDLIDCGNPECLCNIKQEDDIPRCMSRENDYYNDSYLN